VALNLFTVAPETPFLDALARAWLAGDSDPLTIGRGLILLPTRRAARSLAEAFLRANDGRPLLLPRITALGALDEAPLALSGALDLPPAIEPMQRLAALTRLILQLDGRNGAPRSADRAWPLARELAGLMDEAERAGVDLATALPDAADPSFAHHWAETLKFLHIVTDAWPKWLTETGVMNPAARQVALLDAQAAAWTADPPEDPVLIAGTTGGIPAVGRLLKVVAGLPNGRVVLPHLDRTMSDAAWEKMAPSHAQAGLARLLGDLGAGRGDVRVWGDDNGGAADNRFHLLSRALLPAEALNDWMDGASVALDGLSRLTATDQQHEAQSIALVLRDALETPGARAALVTPDRSLAERVAASLLRFGIVADDSAGEPLAATPPAVFLRLLVRAVADQLAPVALLALLKHPFAAAGLTPIACRDAARLLETRCLRGPRPTPGIAGLRRAVQENAGTLKSFLDRLEHCLEPALRFETAAAIPAADALTAVIEAAERLSATDEAPGAHRLWAGEDGEALASALSELRAASTLLPDLRRGVLPGLLDEVLQGAVVRSRRALRAGGTAEHPRIFIWGLLEARLQAVDLVVLGGLAETIWPPAAEPGPWLSRPMRTKIGLPAPEQMVGQTAHDFLSACCAAPHVVLSCPARRDNAPAVPSRWLTRLDMFLAARRQALPAHPAASWAAALDQPDGEPSPVKPPRPCPPVHLRPRRLSVTEIETWLRDPYAIHARHILKLPVLKPLEEATDAADYGMIVHEAMHLFLARHGAGWPADAQNELRAAMRRALASAGLRPALQAWWGPRLERIADWVTEQEILRRSIRAPVAINPEAGGRIDSPRPGGPFRLTGRADRIERYPDATLAILDYKTGRPPAQKDVDAGLAPQLVLEAAMAMQGGFGDEWTGDTHELVYWHLTGGMPAGTVFPLFKKAGETIPDAAMDALERLGALADAFDQPDKPYLSRPNPDTASRFPEYDQLARVAEWSAAGSDDEEG
jgi:ATP-dependent helicase/nuclease subunit B